MVQGFERGGFAPRSGGRWIVAGDRQVEWTAEAIRGTERQAQAIVLCPSLGVTEFHLDHLVEALAAGAPGRDTLVFPAVSELGWSVDWKQLATVVSHFRPKLVIDVEYARYAPEPQADSLLARSIWYQPDRRNPSAWIWGRAYPAPATERQEVTDLAGLFRTALRETAGIQLAHPTDPATGIVSFRVAPWGACEASEILFESHGFKFGVARARRHGEDWLRASFWPGLTPTIVLAAAEAVRALAARSPHEKLVH